MKKRYIAIGLIALDILCIPVAAKLVDNVSFETPTHAVATELPRNEPGVANIVVSSNGPFVLTASNLNGEADIRVSDSGAINTVRFGDNAQLPGPAEACAAPDSDSAAVIYSAQRATVATPGEILNQSVIITIRFDNDADPAFDVFTPREGRKIPHAAPCSAA